MGDTSLSLWISATVLTVTALSVCLALISWRSRRRAIRVACGSWLVILALASIFGPFTDMLFSLVVGPVLAAFGIWMIVVPRKS
jgi:hypothetical protein